MFRSVTSEPKNLILARAAELAPPEADRGVRDLEEASSVFSFFVALF